MSSRYLKSAVTLTAALAAGLFMNHGVNAAGEKDFRKITPPGSYGTVLMNRTSRDLKDLKPVLFPHWVHRAKYSCKACHTDLNFPLKSNTVDIKQADLDGGKYCGKCHNGTVSFGLNECERCHSYRIETGGGKKIEDELKDLPKDDFGNKVNWAKAAKEGKIKPGGVSGEEKLPVNDAEIIIPVKKFKPHPPDVLFPHKPHTEQMECAACHPSIFVDKKGGNPDMNMLKIISGQYCGTCHGKVAFPLEDCFRCHSQPPEKLKEEPAKDDKAAADKDKKDTKK